MLETVHIGGETVFGMKIAFRNYERNPIHYLKVKLFDSNVKILETVILKLMGITEVSVLT